MRRFEKRRCVAVPAEQQGKTGPGPGLAEPPLRGLSPRLDAPTMLIIEDAPLIAYDLAETMRELGFEIGAIVATHDEAWQAIRESPPQFAIVDLHLDGKQGNIGPSEDLLAYLEALGCRCLIFSGDAAACLRMSVRFPNFAVVTKPAQTTRLIAEMKRLRDGC